MLDCYRPRTKAKRIVLVLSPSDSKDAPGTHPVGIVELSEIAGGGADITPKKMVG